MKAGDRGALDALLRRILPRLTRWTRPRVPPAVRDAADTADIVQDTVMKSLAPLQRFEPRGPGAVDAYLRQAVMNRIRDEIRRAARRPQRSPLRDIPGPESPLRDVISRDDAARYEKCLARLREPDRRAILGRLADGLSYEELARRLNKPSAEAARIGVTRALMRLAREMQRAETR